MRVNAGEQEKRLVVAKIRHSCKASRVRMIDTPHDHGSRDAAACDAAANSPCAAPMGA
ncbi:hypothetical protein GCM10010363_15070 [Streptomyces omiyaensis]|nr:hypothetical protein GCM10010363_15070 [Streptomyces omiyaensis]